MTKHYLMKVKVGNSYYTFEELHQMTGIKTTSLKTRYYQGKEGQELIRPLGNQARLIQLEPDGPQYTFQMLSHKYGIKLSTLNYRYRNGYRNKELIRPVQTKYASNNL